MARPVQSHPSREALTDFVLGKLPDAAAAEVEEHLTACTKCQAELRKQEPRDTLVGLIQLSVTTVEPASPNDLALSVTTAYVPNAEKKTALPEVFGRYRIRECLGKGGMGAVYLARDTKLDRDVALKVPQLDPRDSLALLERFRREARAMGEFRHPNLCPIYDVDELDGIHFYTMPFIAGISLQDWLRKHGKLSPSQTAGLIRKLALGLLEAHRRGVIHRDLKPSNVMIEKTARGTHEPIIVDFGLARRDKGLDLRLTRAGAPMGTPAYMPPEQLLGQLDQVGVTSDVYSLGATMYELLTGQPPFNRTNWAALTDDILHKPPRPPQELRPEVDPRLAEICLKCLAKRPKDRYPSMKELAADLEEYLTPRRPSSQVSGEVAVPGPANELSELAPGRLSPLLAGVRGRPMLLAGFAAAAATIFLLGIIIIIETRRGERIRIETDAKDVRVAIQEQADPPAAPAKSSSPAPTPDSRQTDRSAQEQADPPAAPAKSSSPAPTPDSRQTDRSAEPAQDWRSLFNGKDLSGWVRPDWDQGEWSVANGVLIGQCGAAGAGLSAWLESTRRDYSDFHLRAELCNVDDRNKFIDIRANSVVLGEFRGYRIALGGANTLGGVYQTGTLWRGTGAKLNAYSPDSRPTRDLQLKPSAWYTLDIVVTGGSIQVMINGEQIVNYTDNAPLPPGRIEFQVDANSELRIRSVRIKEPAGAAATTAASPQPTGPISLFNGRDLAGWIVEQTHPQSSADQWRVVNGVIEATSPGFQRRNYLLTTRDYANFRLNFDFMIEKGSNGGVALRAIPNESLPWGASRMFDHPLIKLVDPARSVKEWTGTSHWMKDGQLFTVPAGNPSMSTGTWHRMAVMVNRHRCTAALDGKPLVDLVLDPDPKKYDGCVPGLLRMQGRVGFQINTGTLRFRNVIIEELPP